MNFEAIGKKRVEIFLYVTKMSLYVYRESFDHSIFNNDAQGKRVILILEIRLYETGNRRQKNYGAGVKNNWKLKNWHLA